MRVGVIGWGIVGSACGEGFRILGHSVTHYDPKFNTTVDDVLNTDIVFVCVPTPPLENGECDVSIIKSTIAELKSLGYNGVIAIKSTLTPGTTQALIEQYNDPNICYVPEFLKEANALADFVINHDVLAVGCQTDRSWNTVVEANGWIPKSKVRMLPSEAEILKYYSNTFNALRVTFANVMYEICQRFGADYSKVLDTFLLRKTASPDYLECSPELRGYGGQCLPKDVQAMAHLCDKLNLPFDLFWTVDHDNKQVETTTPKGMRK
jgi:UDPglucose 6-dehydrogenase